MSDEGTAARYRQRAEDLRAQALSDDVADIRRHLLDLAAVYDHLAQEIEDIDASDKVRER